VSPYARALLAAAALAVAGCTPPKIIRPYRMNIQQGNYVSQEMVAQLKPGMTKEQVRYVLGTPLITDIFHADRWDYVYYYVPAYSQPQERKITVLFDKDGRLSRVEGDVVPAKPAPAKGEVRSAPDEAADK
jgi:outer membrane protein assembly factor BamE